MKPARLWCSQRGQMVVITALLVPVLLGLVGIALDAGLLISERTKLQRAADAAALAGAGGLPDYSTATTMALQWSGENDYSHGEGSTIVNVTTNYDGDPDKIEVEIDSEASTVFLKIFGLNSVPVSARAVALRDTGGGYYTIFANDNTCNGSDTLVVSGSAIAVQGRVHSNALLRVSGSENTFDGDTTYVCTLDVSGQNNTFTPASHQTGIEPMPLDYTYDDFPCTMEFTEDTDLTSVPAAWLNGDKDTGVLLDGVYCSTSNLSLSSSDVTGNITLAAQGTVSIAGSNFNITGY